MNVIIQYYNDKNLERQKEYDFCLEKNLNNPAIKKIYNIIEKETVLPERFTKHEKIVNIPFDYSKNGNISGRITFKYVFEFAKKNIEKNEIICIVNLDIFFDYSNEWKNIKKEFFDFNSRNALCLSRYEFNWNNTYYIENSQWGGASSDAWIFLNSENDFADCDFAIGNAPGCDAAICKRFYNNKYIIYNWPQKYRLFHVDICRGHKNGIMIINDKTDNEGKHALNRGRLDCSPNQDWEKILNNNLKPIYKIS